MGNFELDLTSHLFYKFVTVVSTILLYRMCGIYCMRGTFKRSYVVIVGLFRMFVRVDVLIVIYVNV